MASTAVAVAAVRSRSGKFVSMKDAGVGLMCAYLTLVKTKPKISLEPLYQFVGGFPNYGGGSGVFEI